MKEEEKSKLSKKSQELLTDHSTLEEKAKQLKENMTVSIPHVKVF